MKRYLAFTVVFLMSVALIGCDSGGEAPTDTGDGQAATDDAAPGDGTAAVGEFKEGVDSGRNEDGSDEDK